MAIRVLLTLLFPLALWLSACGPQHFKGIEHAVDNSDLGTTLPIDTDPPENNNPSPIDDVGKHPQWIAFPWDGKHKDSQIWNDYAYTAISSNSDSLLTTRPSDVLSFCPNYDNLNIEGKRMFWIGLFAAMAKFESNWKPELKFTEGFNDTNGNRVISRGLLQLSYESSKAYDCPLDNPQQLHDTKMNLLCTTLIMDRWIGRDKVITKNNSGWKGGARYWSVLRKSSTLGPIRTMTKNLEVCK